MRISPRPGLIWGSLAFYCLLVFIASAMSSVPSELNRLPDYVLHAIEYFLMGLLAHIAFRQRPLSYGPIMAGLMAVIFCLAFAATDEFHQYFVKGRDASFRDIGADVVGAALAQAIIFTFRRIRSTRARRRY